ncbi:uncharacterized protein KZ484_000554 [Pholidichthys leucotaenia]
MTAWVVLSHSHFQYGSRGARCEGKISNMNLYRSFGNLMETWITEEDVEPESDWPAKDISTPSSDMEANLRSESVDSGVETASSDMSFPTPSTDNGDTEREELTPVSTLQSPVFSRSSSSSLPLHSPSQPDRSSTNLHLKLQRALQRADSKQQNDDPKALTGDVLFRQQPQAPLVVRRHMSDLVRGQRSASFGLGRTLSPPASVQDVVERCRRPLPARSEGLGAEETKELSPGFTYLEQVCQMLEEMARQKMQERDLQFEAVAFREEEDMQMWQSSDTSQAGESGAALEDASDVLGAQNAAHSSKEPREQQQRGHFRQRSASDTTLAALHSKRLKDDYRGQHWSKDDLLEEAEEDHENQDTIKEAEEEQEGKKDSVQKSWRLKLANLRRGDPFRKSQQTQPSDRNSARRRLSQLLKRKGKTASA